MEYKILIVDDSALMRRYLCDIIQSDKLFHVTDTCRDGVEAYEKITQNEYDAVVLDMVLPRMNGVSLLKKLQSEQIQVPVIAISSSLKEDAETIILAMERGAFDFVVKPFASNRGAIDVFASQLLEVLNNAVKNKKPKPVEPAKKNQTPSIQKKKGNQLIALACSTGGPRALHQLVPMLPADLPVPMIIVQHMPAGFTESLATRLNTESKVTVKEAEDGEQLKNGVVYIAPGGRHMKIIKDGSNKSFVQILDTPPVNSLRPCADVTYESLLDSIYSQIICVVLTGMGMDGTKGIQMLKNKKDIYVITESQATCTVYGMPRAVESAGLSHETVPIQKVANAIVEKLEG